MKKVKNGLIIGLLLVGILPYLIGASFGSGVKSIQQGTGTASVSAGALATVNVTITATVLAKTEVRAWVANAANIYAVSCAASAISPILTSTTNLRLFIVGPTNASATYTWEIIEYY